MGNFVAEKRTLSFEGDSKVPMKRKTTSETRVGQFIVDKTLGRCNAGTSSSFYT